MNSPTCNAIEKGLVTAALYFGWYAPFKVDVHLIGLVSPDPMTWHVPYFLSLRITLYF